MPKLLSLRAQLAAVTGAAAQRARTWPTFLQPAAARLRSAVLLTDPQGRITWANGAFWSMCHCTLAQLLGLLLAHLPPDLQPDAASEATVSEQPCPAGGVSV